MKQQLISVISRFKRLLSTTVILPGSTCVRAHTAHALLCRYDINQNEAIAILATTQSLKDQHLAIFLQAMHFLAAI